MWSLFFLSHLTHFSRSLVVISFLFWPTFSKRRSEMLPTAKVSKWGLPGRQWSKPINSWEPLWEIRWKCLLTGDLSSLAEVSILFCFYQCVRNKTEFVFVSFLMSDVIECSSAAPSLYWWKHWMLPPLTMCAALSPMRRSSHLSKWNYNYLLLSILWLGPCQLPRHGCLLSWGLLKNITQYRKDLKILATAKCKHQKLSEMTHIWNHK